MKEKDCACLLYGILPDQSVRHIFNTSRDGSRSRSVAQRHKKCLFRRPDEPYKEKKMLLAISLHLFLARNP